MSPQAVNSFVSDLVEMAKAMDQVPALEAEIARLKSVEADLIQAKDYAASLEQKLHNAEVAKDQAETMFLEADDKLHHTLDRLNQMGNIISTVKASLEPPQPEPVKVEIEGTQPTGQDGNHSEQIDDPSLPLDQSEGPYSNHRYYDHPSYLTLTEWLAGGGTEDSYNWRPGMTG